LTDSQETSPGARPARRLSNPAQRRLRDERILERVQGGWDYEDIARKEGLSVRRVRAIVARAMKPRRADPSSDHARLQRVRMAPSLRLAAEAVASGDLRGIDRLLRLLDRLDRYNGAAVAIQADDEASLRLLRERINRAARQNDARREATELRHRNARGARRP
jgi:DNA-binding CsgD family transcriptional regulator